MAAANLTRLKKHKTIPFLDTSAGQDKTKWTRIGKSTVFDLVLNAETEENNFIEDEMATTEIMTYKPSMDQELQTNKGDEAFDYIYDMFYNLPTGEDVKKNVLFVFAGEDSTGKFNAWETVCTLTLDHLDTVAEKIYFKLSINKISRGKATVSAGVPSFTANTESSATTSSSKG